MINPYTHTYLPDVSGADLIAAIPEMVQTAFWIVVATVTVLTYKHAKSTILQPLNTEVFKLQLESMKVLLGEFVGKDEVTLRREFGLDEFFHANTVMMFDAYARSELGLTIDPEGRPYDKCRNWHMHPEDLEVITGPYESEPERGPDRSKPRPEWSEYRHRSYPVPDTMVERMATMRQYLQDPLLPTKCVLLIEELISRIDDTVHALSEVLTEASQRLPDHYPDADSLARSDPSWIHNEWNARTSNIEPKATAITQFARAYFRSDAFNLSATP